MLDLSNRTELSHLADLAATIKRAVADLRYFLAGAQARDLLLEYAHGINPRRDTTDLDFAIMVADWAAFDQVRQAFIASGSFTPARDVQHKLAFRYSFEVDLIPFGAIERADRTIAWPPNGDVVMDVFGFSEAYEDTLQVVLPGGEHMRVVSLHALALLKLIAWEQRRRQRPGADAHDIAIILRHYVDAGNSERLYTEAAHLLEAPDFDYEYAGAWLLGHDMARVLPESTHARVDELLTRESDAGGKLTLIGDLGMQPDRALGLLQSLAQGFREKST